MRPDMYRGGHLMNAGMAMDVKFVPCGCIPCGSHIGGGLTLMEAALLLFQGKSDRRPSSYLLGGRAQWPSSKSGLLGRLISVLTQDQVKALAAVGRMHSGELYIVRIKGEDQKLSIHHALCTGASALHHLGGHPVPVAVEFP